ncbi:G-protein alpha subunit [Klebsormidium nitens]|uniref:G-protein alpha subunit n=1 Tax=Klebsormidium nitens TaxID=105231 RepID=A0A0U9HTH3_KLENI|nr:G-protein alpha subunit [Klebsormidium nitens]|eukprot:GAQ87162.1 G-protein alpha subunit [Klebsormidium nitens]
MGCAESKEPEDPADAAEAAERAAERSQNQDIEKDIKRQDKEEEKIQKLLLLGAGESGKSTIFKQVKVLYQSGFTDAERAEFRRIVHSNVYQSIRILLEGLDAFQESSGAGTTYTLKEENQMLAEKVEDIALQPPGDMPVLDEILAAEISQVWMDPAVQAVFDRANELQLPDCAAYFLNDVMRLGRPDYLPTQEDILFARVRTTGIAETEFSPPKESGVVSGTYRIFDVGGQRNERKKWIHLFDNVTAVIFCIALSEYDQTLFEDETENRMVEAKNLLEEMLQHPAFKNVSFLLFLNKYDLFEKKVRRVSLTQCPWFSDYTGSPDPDVAFRYVTAKFQQLFENYNPPGQFAKRFFAVPTTATDSNKVNKAILEAVKEIFVFKQLESGVV